MTVLMATHQVFEEHAAALARIAAINGARGPLEFVELPASAGDIPPSDVDRITAAYHSRDVRGALQQRFQDVVRDAPHIEWVHTAGAGVDPWVELMGRGVIVSNAAVSGQSVALTAIGGLLALARGFPAWSEAQRRHEWRRHTPDEMQDDLSEQTMVIVGMGDIGRRVARMARALGLTVIGVRRTPAGPADGIDAWVPPERLAEVLPRAHWLVLTVPLTEQTRGLINARVLAQLPRGAHLINVSRGAIVDEPAVIEAVRSGQLHGAYLDVFAQEPLPAGSPLWDLPNVIISPHNSGASKRSSERADAIFLDELERWQRGETPSRAIRLEG